MRILPSQFINRIIFFGVLIALTPYGNARTKSSAEWMRLIQMERAKTNSIRRPSSPTNLNSLNIGTGQVTLQWTPPVNDGGSPIMKYRVEVIGNPSKTTLVPGSSTSATISGLKDGKNYRFSVKSITQPDSHLELLSQPAQINALVKSPPRQEAVPPTNLAPAPLNPAIKPVNRLIPHPKKTVPRPPAPVVSGSPPGAPWSLQGTAVGTGVYLSWVAPLTESIESQVGLITGYLIEYSADEGNNWQSQKSYGASPTTFVQGLQPNSAYLFRVAATNSAGTGPSSGVDGELLACGICDSNSQVTPFPCSPVDLEELDVGGIREVLSHLPCQLGD